MNPWIYGLIRALFIAKSRWDDRNLTDAQRSEKAFSGCLLAILMPIGIIGGLVVLIAVAASIGTSSPSSPTVDVSSHIEPADNIPQTTDMQLPQPTTEDSKDAGSDTQVENTQSDSNSPKSITTLPSLDRPSQNETPRVNSLGLPFLNFKLGTDQDRVTFDHVAAAKYILLGDFSVAYAKLCDDNLDEVVLISHTRYLCNANGCSSVVLEKRGLEYTVLLDQYLPSELVITNLKAYGCHVLAGANANGQISNEDSKDAEGSEKNQVYSLVRP